MIIDIIVKANFMFIDRLKINLDRTQIILD